jgi:rhodanese-related sulfurtransferase
MQADGEDLVVVDGRPFSEYQKMNIPGGICCPNAELPYRIGEIVKSPKTKIIVNCAGRTRSIMGAQTLINFGIENPVYALENGTQGWVLADMALERGASRRYPDAVAGDRLPTLQSHAKSLMARHGVLTASAAEVQAWLREDTRTTFLLDVRTPEEFAKGSIPGAVHAPGGQLIQATDQWVGVRNARIVLLDGEGVRAPVVASWLKQLGCDVYVLEGGVGAKVSAEPAPKARLPQVAQITPEALQRALDVGGCTVFDLRPSMSFREAHIPRTRWSIRSRLVEDARDARDPVVLVCDELDLARLAAADLFEAHHRSVKILEGSLRGWTEAGLPTEASADTPADRECIDYLFFVHDRHAGNREAMKQYLAWETGLMAQLDAEDRELFRVGVA